MSRERMTVGRFITLGMRIAAEVQDHAVKTGTDGRDGFAHIALLGTDDWADLCADAGIAHLPNKPVPSADGHQGSWLGFEVYVLRRVTEPILLRVPAA